MVANLMMLAKLATLGLLTMKIFRKTGYDVITPSMTSPVKFYHATQIIL